MVGNEESGRRAEGGSWMRDGRPQLAARAARGSDFSIFFSRNPLKRLNSEKKVKGNERTFAFIFFHFLCFSFPGIRARVVD
jgi:hypothetical protein